MYNVERYVGECLDSVLLQTLQNFEVIVVDDCSTDDSIKIVREYAPKFKGRLRLFSMEKNSGTPGKPRNRGIELARGEYIFFADADDFMLLSTLETLYEAARKYDADVVYTSAHYLMKKPNEVIVLVDGEGKKLRSEGRKDKPVLIVDDVKKNLDKLFIEGNFHTPWTAFVRREFLLEGGLFFPDMPSGEDFLWVIKLYCHAKRFLRLPVPLHFYRNYNEDSITQKKRSPQEQYFHWVTVFVTWAKNFSKLAKEIDLLRDNPIYCYQALKSEFDWCCIRGREGLTPLKTQEAYELLYQKFAHEEDLSLLAMPFFFTLTEATKKARSAHLQIISDLRKEIKQLNAFTPTISTAPELPTISAKASTFPAVSVVIPLYNYEKYIGECLESLLAQTFQDFEVIVVDDCSTDNSLKVVEGYAPKFKGRLTITRTKKNSGSGGPPRNKGLSFSRGEYIQFLDADDMLTKTALAEMYLLAKEYKADVVYCESHYEADEDGKNVRVKVSQKGALVNKPTWETEDLKERVDKWLNDSFQSATCFKFVRRDFMLQNEIFFPQTAPSEDNIWSQGLVLYAKKFLRVPNAIYIIRLSEGSIMRQERSAQQEINFYMNPVLQGLKNLDDMISRHEFFKANPSYRYALLKMFIGTRFNWSLHVAKKMTEEEIYSAIKEQYAEYLGEHDVLIPALCAVLYDEKSNKPISSELPNEVKPFITARIDVKLMTAAGDLKVLSVSDNNANVSKPRWMQQNSVAYLIESYAMKIEFVAKATTSGQIRMSLRSMDVRDPKDRNKRLIYWIDYTRLVVNGKTIFDKLTPIWHDKPYHHKMEVKAGEEITIGVKWQPHRSDT